MRCSVVIPCHNGADLTRACVASLLAQAGAPDLEILLVDNASSDDTPALAEMHPAVRVLRHAQNLGFAGGVNAGVRAASHPLVLIVNNDTQAAPNLLASLSRALVSDPRIGAVAPVSNHVKGRAHLPIGDCGRDPGERARIAAELAGATAGQVQDVDTLAGLCLLMRRETLADVGLFDERFGRGNFEDDDLCLRLRLAGYRLLVVRDAFLHHEGHATFRALGLDLAGEIRRRQVQFVGKWQDDPAGRAVTSAMLGDLDAAADAAAAARIAHPRWPDSDWHLARWHARHNRPLAAAAHFAALLRSCPHHSDAAIGLCLALLDAELADAARAQLAWTMANCHLTPADGGELLRRTGEHAHGRGRHDDAIAAFGAALDLAPDDGALHNALGAVLLDRGDLAPAIAAFERATERGFPLAHTNLGICHYRRGDRGAASRAFGKAVELLPHDPVARANHAALCAR